MAAHDSLPDLDDHAATVISFKARQLVGRAGWTRSDREDIEQDLRLDLLRRLPRFNPARGTRRSFVRHVVEKRVCTLLEGREAAMRDYRRHGSLDEEIDDGNDGAESRGDTLDAAECLERLGRPVPDEETARDLRLDLDAALGSLPPHLRDFSYHLKTATPSELARATGVPRTTLLKRMARIRAHLERAGLAAYLPAPASTRREPR